MYDAWQQSMQGGAMPVTVGAPELAPPVPAPLPQAPAPLQIGPDEQIAETAPPLAAPEPAPVAEPAAPVADPAPVQTLPTMFDASSWGATPPTPPMPERDAYGMLKDTAVVPPSVGEIDAISGAEAMPPPPGGFQLPAPSVGQPGDTTRGGVDLTEEELVDLAHRDPVAYAKYNAQKDAELADFARQRTAELQKQDADRAEAEYRDMLAARKRADEMDAQLDRDAQALANEKPKGYMDSVGNAVGAVVGIILGQFGAAATGGKNVGLEMVNAQIDRHIATERDAYNRKAGNIDRRTNAIARLREAGMSDYQAASTFRIAALGRARDQLLTDMQNYDPKGTAARQMAAAAISMEQQMAGARESARQKNLDEGLKLAKEAREQQEIAEKVRAAKANERLAGWRIAEDKRQANQRLDFDKAKLEQEDRKLAKDESRKEATEERELSIGGPTRVTGVDAQGKPIIEAGAPLVQKDGKTPFKARSKEVGEKLTKQITAAGEVVDIIDEIISIRDRSGGESKLFNSDDKQRLDVLQNRLVVLQKSGTEGMSSDEDMKKLAGAAGADDVSSFRARAAGLEKARERIHTELNRTYRNNRYTGDAIDFPNRFKDAPAATQHEKEQTLLVAQPQVSVDDAKRQAMGILRSKYPTGKLTLEQSRQLSAEADEYAADYKDISPEQKDRISKLGVEAAGTGPEADRARADLDNIIKNGQTAKLRDAAGVAQKWGKPITSTSEPGVTTNAPTDLSRFGGQ